MLERADRITPQGRTSMHSNVPNGIRRTVKNEEYQQPSYEAVIAQIYRLESRKEPKELEKTDDTAGMNYYGNREWEITTHPEENYEGNQVLTAQRLEDSKRVELQLSAVQLGRELFTTISSRKRTRGEGKDEEGLLSPRLFEQPNVALHRPFLLSGLTPSNLGICH
ncbi:hypothetical protein C8R44DRAFT_754960 [Mycena epipterygia]|nr:hypothetical protein C8R44DRAFT_754960 [Mycena epipterygia]